MKFHNKIGIMHGRLSTPIGNKIQEFPKNTWESEFDKARSCGFELIEWIFDTNDKNPLMIDDGIQKIKHVSEKTGVYINSVLADFFMEKKLVNVSEFELQQNLDTLKNLISNTSKLGATILEIPFVDSSSLTTIDEQKQLVSNLEKILPLLEECCVVLTLETDLPPNEFKELLLSFNHHNIKANYDVGNSAALGYDLKEEMTSYGNLIGNIHIKDREFHGKTVPLGSGSANFELFFDSLRQINYRGDLIIQGARESGTAPENTCMKYLQFVRQYAEKYLLYNNWGKEIHK